MYHVPDRSATKFVEPITIEEIRDRLAITQEDDTDRDSTLMQKVQAARELLEIEAGSIFLLRGFTSYADSFDQGLELLQPLQTVNNIFYTDIDGNEQVLDPNLYYVDRIRHRVVFKPNVTIPATIELPNSVRIQYSAGFDSTDPNGFPQQIKEAIMVTVGQWEIHQSDMQTGVRPMLIPLAAKQMINGYRDFRNHF